MAGAPGDIKAELALLERSDQLEAAAELAEQAGLERDAARLWERACRFERAARAALRAGEPGRALLLAARAAAIEVEREAIRALLRDAETAARVAEQLAVAGQARAAGELWIGLGDAARAGAVLERAAMYQAAADALLRAGDLRGAARCLEAALNRSPGDQQARLELGALLSDAGKLDAAVRHLQQIPKSAAERGRALELLLPLFGKLGLAEAVAEVERELAEHAGHERAPGAAGAERAPRPPPEPLLFGRYEVVRLVATTPTARVYEALDRLNGDRVAVKLFSASALRDAGRDALRRFEREARALGELRHPSIVRLRVYLPEGPAVVLDWMAGGSLAELLDRAPIAPARAAEITLSVLSALGEAHRRGILHRDIKPANVLFDTAGAAMLADFGAAHLSDAAATVTAGILGTVAYMAPEQRSGAPASVSSDVYGAGALFWHALSGGPPGLGLAPLSDELGEQALGVATTLIGSEAERPRDTQAARALIESVTWPRKAPLERRAIPSPPSKPPTRSLRLEPRGGALHFDTLLERELYVLAGDSPTLERLLPFARANQALFPSVLAHRPDEHQIWLEAPSGAPLERPLEPAERAELRTALEALHRAGGVHGRVDREHLVLTEGGVLLRFSLETTGGSAEDDLEALDRL